MNKKIKVYVDVSNEDQWYDLIREANSWFGRGNWRGQKHVRRKFMYQSGPISVWFEVPDAKFASYVTLKYSSTAQVQNG